ncbi:unnamed protein product [marine sediment metagenome]|uniref:Uncharacterized protein n=1 Tax=marine sediment metagenome TaxID=412755 RepID=X1FCJ7_9ZZZZ
MSGCIFIGSIVGFIVCSIGFGVIGIVLEGCCSGSLGTIGVIGF